MSYLTEEKGWSIVLFEKIGTAFTEVEVLWEETTTAEEAYEMWLEPFGSLPPRIAVDHALSCEEEPRREYEARFYCEKRCLATMLWTKESLHECLEDAKNRKVKKFIVAAEITIDVNESDDFNEWDLEELVMLDCVQLLDSTPVNEVD